MVLCSLLELSKGQICPDCGNDFVLVYTHRWRCKEKLHSAHSTTQGNHDNDILHHMIENPPNSLVNLNNDIYSTHGEGHLTSYDFTCYCIKSVKVSEDLELINVPVVHQI